MREIESTFRKACQRERSRLIHYSLQSDHVHLIVESANESELARLMKSISARLARAVNRALRRRGPVIADRYHARALRTPREVRNAIAYVLLNRRRHLEKRGSRPLQVAGIDPASSGRWFSGWILPQPAAHDPPATALPRTWLLREGWHRFGGIDAAKLPGCLRQAGLQSEVQRLRHVVWCRDAEFAAPEGSCQSAPYPTASARTFGLPPLVRYSGIDEGSGG